MYVSVCIFFDLNLAYHLCGVLHILFGRQDAHLHNGFCLGGLLMPMTCLCIFSIISLLECTSLPCYRLLMHVSLSLYIDAELL